MDNVHGAATKFTSNPANTPEAEILVNELNAARIINPESIPGDDRAFLADMTDKMVNYGKGLVVSGKQVERLRRIKTNVLEGTK